MEGAEEIVGIGKGYSQYYATVDLVPARVGRTRVLKGEPSDPVWNESFRIYCAHTVPDVQISIKDDAILGTAVVGRAKVSERNMGMKILQKNNCLVTVKFASVCSFLKLLEIRIGVPGSKARATWVYLIATSHSGRDAK